MGGIIRKRGGVKMNIRRIIIVGLPVLLICSIMVGNLTAEVDEWRYKTWSIYRVMESKFLMYISHGNTVYGNQFGFLKKSPYCDDDTLFILLSTYVDNKEEYQKLKAFEGSIATLQFRVGDIEFQGVMGIGSVKMVVEPIVALTFLYVTPKEEFIYLLKEGGDRGQTIEVRVIAPEDLASKFTPQTDSFNLGGFTVVWQKAREFCEKF